MSPVQTLQALGLIALTLFTLPVWASSGGPNTTYGDLNFNATFGDSPAPFKIDVSPDFIKNLLQKVSLTRNVALQIDEPGFSEGPTHQNVSVMQDYWLNQYDWFEVQRELNRKFNHFTTTVTTGPKSNYTDPVPLHFIHHKSPRSDAIPLLFSHGWPGSFLEASKILDGLTNPPNTSYPAFHVVAPSIPGFAFSPAPTKRGFGNKEAAHAYNALMLQLGYTQYVTQGGDFGGVINRYLTAAYPEHVLSSLFNLYIVPPNATDWARYRAGQTTPEENRNIQGLATYVNFFSGYRFIMQTRPLAVAVGMNDSPIGNMMWIYDFMQRVVDGYVWTPEELVTWTMMYQIQGPYGGMRWYFESEAEGTFVNLTWSGTSFPYISQPIAVSGFPLDGGAAPFDWIKRTSNIVQRVDHNRGGHFAAYEVPDLLLADIRKFWGNLSALGIQYP